MHVSDALAFSPFPILTVICHYPSTIITMPTLTILTDANVCSLLSSIRVADVLDMQHALRKALYDFSTGTQDDSSANAQQPERTVLMSPNGTTSLFMPSASSMGLGCKGM